MPVADKPTPDPNLFMHYQLGQCLGEGGVGQVFEAFDTKLHRKVAIKYLKNIVPGTDLLKEARLAASLNHPAFVKVHSLENSGGAQAIVMELVPGKTLRQLSAIEPISINQVLDIVRQVAQAMAEAHAVNLIHGDIKPSNLMCESNGAVRILDFGLATQSDRDATTSLVQSDPQGTIAYMAPELLTGGNLKPSSDIYALGVILYELLTGRRPFFNLSGLALAAALIQSESVQWTWPGDLPASLRELMLALTSKDATKRLQSMEEVVRQCDQLLALDLPTMHSVSLNLAALQLKLAANPVKFNEKIIWPAWTKHLRVILFVAILCLSLFAIWSSAPYWSQWSESLIPYSESREMNLGLTALAQSDRHEMLDTAEQHFSIVLSHTSDNAAAIASMSLLYSYRFERDPHNNLLLKKAKNDALKALQLNDLLALSHVAHAKTLNMEKHYAEALIALEHAFSLDPYNRFALGLKIDALMQTHNYTDAYKLANQSLLQYPKERLFADQIGEIYAMQSDYKAAQDAYSRSIDMQADAVNAYLGLSNALLKQNKVNEAVQILEKGLKRHASAELNEALGKALMTQGNYVAAVSAFENTVSTTGGNADDYSAWASYANALAWLPGRAKDAKIAYTKARDLLQASLPQNPNNTEVLSYLALFSSKINDSDIALRYINQCLALKSDNGNDYLRAAIVFEIIKKRAEAIAALKMAKKLGVPTTSIESEPELVSLRRDPQYINTP